MSDEEEREIREWLSYQERVVAPALGSEGVGERYVRTLLAHIDEQAARIERLSTLGREVHAEAVAGSPTPASVIVALRGLQPGDLGDQ